MKAKVLVVEDDAVIRMTLGDRLEAEGYTVEFAMDGETGAHKASRGKFDLVLLDVMLPGKSGFEVCRDIRMAGVVVPILMLTARGQTIDKVLGSSVWLPARGPPRHLRLARWPGGAPLCP
jgi:DNA-binding response OmpR family regulator